MISIRRLSAEPTESSLESTWTEPEIDASGLRISWAMPAASSPTAASCSLKRAWRSSFFTSVRSWKTMSAPSSPAAGSFRARTE